ncbi:MAG: F0F1 ATP synthase subunit B' [Alphaproteobacteria bacterium]|nr:F0F1 ATP synthase subunit B' [Alphaproteobacteria bacterium]
MRFRGAFAFLPVMLMGILAPLTLLASEAEKKEGLPQFDAEMFAGQLFWLAVTFGLLYVLMAYVALPRIARVQDKRQSTISGDLASAAAASEAAKSTIAQYEKALADARLNAQAAVGDIVAQAAKESMQQQAAQQKELAKRLQEANARITKARDAAIGDVQGTAAELAGAIIEKITGTKMQVKK